MSDPLPPMVPTGNTLLHQIIDKKFQQFEARLLALVEDAVERAVAKALKASKPEQAKK